MHAAPLSALLPRARRTTLILAAHAGVLAALLTAAGAQAVDLVNLAAVGGPLVGALATLGSLTPGVKALIGFLTFCVAFVSLAALRNMGPVILFLGVVVFGAVGLVVGGAILGAVV